MSAIISEWIEDRDNSQHVTHGTETATFMSQSFMNESKFHIMNGVAQHISYIHIMWTKVTNIRYEDIVGELLSTEDNRWDA